jgi:hypothetical protein
VVLLLVLMTVIYIFGVARFDENSCQVCIFLLVARYDEEVCADPSVHEFVLHHEPFFVDSWCNNLIHCYNYSYDVDYVLYISCAGNAIMSNPLYAILIALVSSPQSRCCNPMRETARNHTEPDNVKQKKGPTKQRDLGFCYHA